jgi:Skp family chaperone for outer membrane proteins
MKNIIKFFFLFFILPTVLMAQKKSNSNFEPIAYIEKTAILKAVAGFEKNTKEIDSLKQTFSKEIGESVKKLNTKIEQLLSPYNFKKEDNLEIIKSQLKPNDLDKLELYLKENELIDRSSKNYDLMIETMYEHKVQPILNRINQIIEDYAKAKNIKVVFTLENISPALAYIDKGVNITDEIIKRLQ